MGYFGSNPCYDVTKIIIIIIIIIISINVLNLWFQCLLRTLRRYTSNLTDADSHEC